jgi:hypothetical protein
MTNPNDPRIEDMQEVSWCGRDYKIDEPIRRVEELLLEDVQAIRCTDLSISRSGIWI